MLLETGSLRKLVPTLKGAKEQILIDALSPAFEQFEITTPARICACLAQFAHETCGFLYLKELGNAQYFSKYDFRRDLGNNKTGMGGKYCGRGFIQITGYTNYKQAGEDLDLDLISQPELVEQPATAALVSCWWWDQHNLNDLADEDSLASLKKITKIINGGMNGLNSRINYWTAAKTIWK